MSGIPKGLNQKAAKAAMRGKKWGEQDQKRYDVAMGNRKTGKQVRSMRKEEGAQATYDQLTQHIEGGGTLGGRAQKKYDRMGSRIAAREKAKAAKGSSGQPTNPIDQTQTGENDSAPANKDMNYPSVMPGDYTQVDGNDNQVGDNNTRVDGNDNQVGDNNTRVESGRDTNIGEGSGSHTVGDNNSGTVGNRNAVVEQKNDNSQEQNINQDNDIDTSVNGNDNTVINNQDNSVRNYGGDNRSFVYNSSGGGAGSDMPASMATLAGFFDVDDSPAAQAQFNDMYTTMNRDNQKRYAGAAMETFAKYGNVDARKYTPESMATTIGRSTQYSYDKADEQTGHVFGDIWNPNYITENWKMPSPPSEIKSEAGELADKAKDYIEDI